MDEKELNINGSLTHKSILQYNTHTLLWFGFHLLVPHEKKKNEKQKRRKTINGMVDLTLKKIKRKPYN